MIILSVSLSISTLYFVYATELGCSSECVIVMRFNIEGFL